ncbi:unnamed protein product [Merluccius merluccius]
METQVEDYQPPVEEHWECGVYSLVSSSSSSSAPADVFSPGPFILHMAVAIARVTQRPAGDSPVIGSIWPRKTIVPLAAAAAAAAAALQSPASLSGCGHKLRALRC